MMKIEVTVSPEGLSVKPSDNDEKRRIFNTLRRSVPEEKTLEDFFCEVGICGQTFNPAIYKNGWIIQDNFISAQAIVLDIDSKISPHDAKKRLREYHLPLPNLIYRTFSDPTRKGTKKQWKQKVVKKFRMIFIMTEKIYDLSEYQNLVKNKMQKLFPEADPVSATQNFFGGIEILINQFNQFLHPLELIMAVDLYNAKHINTPQGKAKAFEKEKYKTPPNKFHEVYFSLGTDNESDFVSKTTNDYNISKESVKNETKPIRGFDWNEARSEFKLLDDFLSCSQHIGHIQLLGLYSGMARIQGGAKKWKESILKNPTIQENKTDIHIWFQNSFEAGKNPWELEISSYASEDPASLKYERLTDIHFKKGMEAKKLHLQSEITLQQAEHEMELFLKQAIDSKENNENYILKAATGIGKTEKLLSLNLDGCIIAAPTHKLKEEIAKRYRNLGRTVLVTPEIPTLPEAIQQEYDELQAIGEYAAAAIYLKKCSSSEIASIHLKSKEISDFRKKMKKYFKELDACLNSDQLVITTHKRVLFSKFPNHHSIIFDEDPTQYILETNSFTTKDLRIIQDDLNETDKESVQQLLDFANSNDNLNMVYNGNPLKITDMAEFRKTINSNRVFVKGAILPSFKCDYWIATPKDLKDPDGDKKIHYIQKHKLDSTKKLIILSATTNETFCKALYGKIIWKDLSSVEHIGARIQYSNLSLSRSTLGSRNNASNLNVITNFIDNKPVITYKNYRNLFSVSNTKIHYGNCSGYDEFKGEDIFVIGTPHFPPFIYQLVAAELNIEFNQPDIEMDEYIVCHNGFQFKIMTFPHEELRSIQFHFIESELLQACGRNRTLREDATTYLFSNYPLPGYHQHNTRELPQPANENDLNNEEVNESQIQNIFEYGMVSGSL